MLGFEVHPSARISIDSIAADALTLVEKIDIIRRPSGDASRWVSADTITLTDEDIIGDPIMWEPQPDGTQALIFLFHGGDSFGLTELNHRKLEKLTSELLKIKWVCKSVGREYITKSFINWAKVRYYEGSSTEFLEHFIDGCRGDIVERTVWAPVQHLSVEEAFAFGPTRIVPMNEAFYEGIRKAFIGLAQTSNDSFDQFIEEFRAETKGCSAVEVKVFAEPGYAKSAGMQISEDAIGLLRFFSAATLSSTCMSPVALLDAMIVPKWYTLTSGVDGGIYYDGGLKITEVERLIIDKAKLESFKKLNFDIVGDLLNELKLNSFGKAVRSSILSFTRSITFSELSDRLIFALSAIEGLLLRNQSEGIQQNVGERVAFLISSETTERMAIVQSFRSAYKLRSEYIHHRIGNPEKVELDRTFQDIWAALNTAVANLDKFSKREDFIDAIERRKFGG